MTVERRELDELAAALASPFEFDNAANAASWLLSRQRAVLADDAFGAALDLTRGAGGRITAATVRWDVAAQWTPPPAAARGARALYAVTVALGAGHPVALADVLAELDGADVDPVLAACAWAAGRIDLTNRLRISGHQSASG